MALDHYPPPPPDTRTDPRIFSPAGQTFLVGETIFLRGLEAEDAFRVSGWRDSPYPVNAERGRELIKTLTEANSDGTTFWVACRRSDRVPVGSVSMTRYPENDFEVPLTLYADPALPDGSQIRAEMLKLVVEWGFSEGEVPLFHVGFPESDSVLIQAAEMLGMRRDVLLRERLWLDGAWSNRVIYAAYHPAWLKLLGDPGTGIEHAEAVDDPARWRQRKHPTFGTVEGNPPTNAVMVGPRIYLRPLEMADGPSVVAAARQEPETFFNEGRLPGSVAEAHNHYRTISRPDPQTTVRFAVCLRETGEHIGMNGVYRIDQGNRTAGTESFFHSAAHRNQGYGSEAKQLLLAWAFDRIGLHSVHSWVWGPNERSAAALRKQGYRDAGRVFWSGTKHGEYTHGLYFDFLADEWREMQRNSFVG